MGFDGKTIKQKHNLNDGKINADNDDIRVAMSEDPRDPAVQQRVDSRRQQELDEMFGSLMGNQYAQILNKTKAAKRTVPADKGKQQLAQSRTGASNKTAHDSNDITQMERRFIGVVDLGSNPGHNPLFLYTSNRQRRIVKVGLTLMVLMLLFPPFYYLHHNGFKDPAGFGFLLSPPSYQVSYEKKRTATMDIKQLFVQWLCVGVVTGVLVFINRPIRIIYPEQ